MGLPSGSWTRYSASRFGGLFSTPGAAFKSDVFHFESKVVQAGLKIRPFDLALGLNGYDREVNLPVAKISCRTDAMNYLKAESVYIELNQFVHVLRENSNVLD